MGKDFMLLFFNILQICSQMNSYSDACMTLVSQNIEQIFSALEQSLQKDACQPLGFCDESQSKVCYHFQDERLLVKLFDDNALKTCTADSRFCPPSVEWQKIRIQTRKIAKDEWRSRMSVLWGACEERSCYAHQQHYWSRIHPGFERSLQTNWYLRQGGNTLKYRLCYDNN